MLVSLIVENFKSFGKKVEFSMIASNKLRTDEYKKVNLGSVSLLKSAVVYGANASGKSNLVEVFLFFRNAICDEGIYPKYSKSFCKNSAKNENKESTFEIRFYKNDKFYSYGFDVILKTGNIINEWIYDLDKDGNATKLFLKTKDVCEVNVDVVKNPNDISKFNIYSDDLSGNNHILFLREMNNNKKINEDSDMYFFKEVYDWFKNDLNIFKPSMPITNFEYYYNEASLKKVNEIIRTFDTGISDVSMKEISYDELKQKVPEELFEQINSDIKNKFMKSANRAMVSMRSQMEFFNIEIDKNNDIKVTTLCFKHGEKSLDFGFDEESDGTRRIFDLLDILLNNNKDSIYIVDEMERSLHPNLTYHFIEMLNKYQKKSNIQLIFTTHESTIMTLKLFRKDQIWFVDKDLDNNSVMYPLDKFNIRNDKIVNNDYLTGRFGAIPVFGEFDTEQLN